MMTQIAAAAAAFCAYSAAMAQQDTAQQEQPLTRVMVTGSHIKRIDAETPSPVITLKREDIKATGANTVRQVLDSVTAFDSGTLTDNGSTNSFAKGASGAGMRGLGKQATLVLVNGRRVSNYAFADGGQTTFVNVDTIPADAVERIDIQLDGASAAYGSDAMAGVINIITRNTYQGLRASGSTEQNENYRYGGQTTAALMGGFGDLERDRYNVFANVEAYKRKAVNQDQVRGYYPAWYKQYVNPSYGDPSLYSFPGNLNEPAGAGHASVRTAVASCPQSQRNASNLCTQDINGLTQVTDPAERVNLFSQGRLKISDNVQAFAEVSYSHTKTTYLATPYAIAAGSPITWFDGLKKISQSVAKPKLAVGNPANPYSFPVGIDYRFADFTDMWQSPTTSNQYRVMAGLSGSFSNGWDWETAFGRVGAETEARDRGPDRDVMPGAVASGQYKIGGPNSRDLLNSMFPVTGTDGKSSQDWVDANVSGDLMQLPAGAVHFAVGGEFRREHMYVKSTDNVVQAQIVGRGSLWIDGQRNLSALYGEVIAPITKKLEATGQLRMDKADGFDSHLSPQLGLKYAATSTLMLRSTYGTGFRTPNIPETLGKVGLTGFFNSTLDPRRCDTAIAIRDILKKGTAADVSDASTAYNSGCLTSVPAMISANTGLKPETSRSLTLGAIWEPARNTSLAADYWRIERRNEISYRGPSFVLAREMSDPNYAKLLVRNAVSEQDQRLAARANELSPGANLSWAAGTVQSLLIQYENFGKTETSGIDFDANTRVNFGSYGTLGLGLQNTLLLTYKQWDPDKQTYRPNIIGNYTEPKLTSQFSASWKKGNLTSTLRVRRTSGTSLNYDETDYTTWNAAGCAARIKPTGDLPCWLRPDVRTDLNFLYTGFKNLRLTLNIRNALLEAAPINLRSGSGLRPRSFKVGAEYEF
ncbi:MAG: TonB-dependent receptor plug domain-containing protein [Telluria sp.]